MEMSRTFNVAVEGNIGCGKSTFLNYFKELSPKIQVSFEPIVLWNDVKGFKLFEVFYGNPSRWSTPFESQVMVTFFERQAEKQTAPVRLLERSVHSCRHCFIEAMNRNRQLSDEDLEVFDKFYDWGMNSPTSHLDLIVYLRCSPEICAERIRQRDRKGESAISMDYLNQLHDLHEDWLLGSKRDCVGAPVMVFDCNEPLEVLTNVYFQRRDQVLCGVRV
ncbi:Deoxynucleoside kinase [Taenia crassiceps]|uniref:Deoxynucleoside kinase n=1 Tax=Taenia crassiceps TaxID=6207 RepID=A0ABR4QAY8_9CEST